MDFNLFHSKSYMSILFAWNFLKYPCIFKGLTCLLWRDSITVADTSFFVILIFSSTKANCQACDWLKGKFKQKENLLLNSRNCPGENELWLQSHPNLSTQQEQKFEFIVTECVRGSGTKWFTSVSIILISQTVESLNTIFSFRLLNCAEYSISPQDNSKPSIKFPMELHWALRSGVIRTASASNWPSFPFESLKSSAYLQMYIPYISID